MTMFDDYGGWEPPPSEEEQLLAGALRDLLDHYLALVNSGDAGHWNPEDEAVVKAARAALAPYHLTD